MLILILSSIMLFSHFQFPLAFRADFGLLSGQFLHWIFPMEYWKQSHKELFVNYFQSFEPKSGRKPSNMECFVSGKTKAKYEKCWAFQRKVWHIVLSIVAGRQWDKRAGANSTRWWMLRLWWGFWPWGWGIWEWEGCGWKWGWNSFWSGCFAANRCCDFVLIMYRIIQRSDTYLIFVTGAMGGACVNFFGRCKILQI